MAQAIVRRMMVDVGTTKRGSMTPSRALRIWESNKGLCVLCGTQIDGAREKWFVEHVRALELGGSDDDGNLGPAHYACKPAKDAADHHSAAKAKRNKQRLLGIPKAASRAQLPCGRNSPFKKTFRHGVVPR